VVAVIVLLDGGGDVQASVGGEVKVESRAGEDAVMMDWG
jgi:hypothetical protein